VLLIVNEDILEHVDDWLHDVSCKTALVFAAIFVGSLVGPALLLLVEEVVSPQVSGPVINLATILLRINTSKVSDGECPSLESGTECACSLCWVHLHIFHLLVLECVDEFIDLADSLFKDLVGLFTGAHELGDNTVDLVKHKGWDHTFGKSLTQHCFSLDANSFTAIYDNQCTISNTECSCNLRAEVHVSWRVNQVNQEPLLSSLVELR